MLKISFGVSLILVLVCWVSSHIILNKTISEPLGYYLAYSLKDYTRGDKVLICVISDQHINSMHALGLPSSFNDCPGKSPFLLKTIVAQAGDSIEVSESGIIINGKVQRLTQAFKRFKRINLYPLAKQKMVLDQDEFFVLGNTLNSYDSRYFGPVKKSQIYSKTTLIWQLNHG